MSRNPLDAIGEFDLIDVTDDDLEPQPEPEEGEESDDAGDC